MVSAYWRTSIILLFFSFILLLDQWTKWWALNALSQRTIPVVQGVFEMRLVFNYGSAFGMVLLSPVWLGVLATGITVFFLFLLPRVMQTGFSYAAGVGLFLGGAWGNQVDRFRWGYVVDFFNPSFWAAFNIADIGIVAGLILVFIGFWQLEYIREQRKNSGI